MRSNMFSSSNLYKPFQTLTWHQIYMLFLPALLWSGLFAFYANFNVSAAADVECMGVMACLYVTGYVCLSVVLCRLVGANGWDLSTQSLSGPRTLTADPTRLKAVAPLLTVLSAHVTFCLFKLLRSS